MLFMFDFTLYSIPPMVFGTLFLAQAFFVYNKNRKNPINVTFALAWLSVAFWLLGYSMLYSARDITTAKLWAKLTYVDVIFIPTLFYQFTVVFLKKKRNKTIIFNYIISTIFLLFLFLTDSLISGVNKDRKSVV